jgi:oxygen-independent coproporphyrinogen-3 oxidase
MVGHLVTRLIRRYLIGRQQEFAFRPARELRLPHLTESDLYLHIPFCKNLCPYCPYNRIRYQEDLVGPYTDAMLAEIDMCGQQLGRVKFTSIYIGGGTPTTLIDELGAILGRVRKRFDVAGPVCIETNPGDITPLTLRKLQDYGVSMISVGVQSFDERYLRLIGRRYGAQDITRAIELAVGAGLDSVNLDLMFAFPGQPLRDLEADLRKAIASGANQLTTYPLFTFPYTSVGTFLKLKKVKMPKLATRRVMYRFIHRFCDEQGFRRVSVWGFLRGMARRYSSVTRDLYLGLGAGAGSHVPGGYHLNTFSVPAYIESCSQGLSPIALRMAFTPAMSQFFWLYWRLYDTYIPEQQFEQVFSDGGSARKAERLLALIQRLRLCDRTEEGYRLNERGAFWLHLVQNHFALNYVNTIWTAAKSQPWPEVIRF